MEEITHKELIMLRYAQTLNELFSGHTVVIKSTLLAKIEGETKFIVSQGSLVLEGYFIDLESISKNPLTDAEPKKATVTEHLEIVNSLVANSISVDAVDEETAKLLIKAQHDKLASTGRNLFFLESVLFAPTQEDVQLAKNVLNEETKAVLTDAIAEFEKDLAEEDLDGEKE